MTQRRPAALLAALVSLVLAQAATPAHAQQTNMEFGKNRVQFHDKFDEWLQYESENYITYWYGEARNVGEAAVLVAEANYPKVQTLLEHQMSDKIELIVYTDLSDLKQSNIGADDAFRSETGRVKVEGNKVFVYFDGDHRDLARQVREGTASVILSSMMFGENLQEIVQNAVLLDIPLWFSEGLVAYVGEAWTPAADEELRQYLLANPKHGFEEAIVERPRLAGHAWWRYITQTYGEGTVGNLLYLTRISRSVENAIDYVYSLSFDEVAEGWEAYYRQAVTADVRGRQPTLSRVPGTRPARLGAAGTPGAEGRARDTATASAKTRRGGRMTRIARRGSGSAFKNRHRARVSAMRISPDGKRVAYALNEIGRQEVFVEDLATGERRRVLKVGYRNAIQATDYGYPLLAWNPNNRELGIVYERRDVVQFKRVYAGPDPDGDLDGDGTRAITEPFDPQFQRVYSVDYQNASSLVVSGGVRGVTDIYRYFPETRQSTRLTDDYYNELDVRRGAVAGLPGTFFVSNRPDTALGRVPLDSVLPTQPLNVFFLPDGRAEYPYAIRLTGGRGPSTPRSPVMVDSQRFAFVSDRLGVDNLYTGTVEPYTAYYEQVVVYADGDVRRVPDDWTPSAAVAAEIDTVWREPVVRYRGVTRGRTDLAFGIDLLDAQPRAGVALALAQLPNGLHEVVRLDFDALGERAPRPTTFARGQGGRAAVRPDLRDVLPAWLSGERRGGGEAGGDGDGDEGEVIAEGTGPAGAGDGTLWRSRFEEEAPAPPPTERAFGLDLLTDAGRERRREEGGQPLHAFRPGRIRAYSLRFRTDYLTTTFSNEPLFGGLDNFAATPQDFRQQPAGLLVKLNNKELFEDYILELGARFATTFDASEYYAYIDSRDDRIDRRFGLYHSTRRQRLPALTQGGAERRAKARSIIGLTRWSYPFDVFSSVRATATVRVDRFTPLVVDANSLTDEIDREQRLGLRLEYVFDNTLDYALNVKHGSRAKVYAEVAKRFDVTLTGDADFSFREGLLTLVGFDARHYFRLLRHGVFAVRAAAGTTLGAEKILFYLGNTDGAVASGFNDDIPVAPGDFAYEMAITNLRGFQTNIRNGNSFAVSNAEARLPLLRYLFPRTRSNFVRQFQFVTFTDVGTAWSGRTPFTRDNPINTVTFADDPSYTLTVNYFRDPVVLGFGAGARVSLFGYFLRLDRAWGVETGQVLDPRWHLSLGLDF